MTERELKDQDEQLELDAADCQAEMARVAALQAETAQPGASDGWDTDYPEEWMEEHPNQVCVHVRDECLGYCRALRPNETLAQACEEFGATYEFGDYEGEIHCSAELYENGPDEPTRYRDFVIEREDE